MSLDLDDYIGIMLQEATESEDYNLKINVATKDIICKDALVYNSIINQFPVIVPFLVTAESGTVIVYDPETKNYIINVYYKGKPVAFSFPSSALLDILDLRTGRVVFFGKIRIDDDNGNGGDNKNGNDNDNGDKNNKNKQKKEFPEWLRIIK